MAPSGTGKTTLLRILLGLERPDAGSVTACRWAAVFQEDRLLEAQAEHYALVDFIEKRDLAGFQELTERHINRSKEMCLASLAEQRKHQNF